MTHIPMQQNTLNGMPIPNRRGELQGTRDWYAHYRKVSQLTLFSLTGGGGGGQLCHLPVFALLCSRLLKLYDF